MKIRTLLVASSLFTLVSCKTEQAPIDSVSYWADSSNMALFEVRKETEEQFKISSSLGSLRGTLVRNSIRGVTDLNDSFALEVAGETANYSILGVNIGYRKISKDLYDSLSKSLSAE